MKTLKTKYSRQYYDIFILMYLCIFLGHQVLSTFGFLRILTYRRSIIDLQPLAMPVSYKLLQCIMYNVNLRLTSHMWLYSHC